MVRIQTGGGGGYGDPLARQVESVQTDVLDGYCSLQSAREQYGVVLDADTLTIDMPQTTALRRTRCAFTPPWGLDGGHTGDINDLTITDADGNSRQVRKGTRVPIQAGSVVRIQTGGGGGYGDPLARQVESVQTDVLDGYCSLQSAREEYGVVLDADTLSIDMPQTTALRRTRCASQNGGTR